VSDVYFVNHYHSPAYQTLRAEIEAEYGTLPGVMYVIPYQLPAAAGSYELVPEVFDPAGNSSLKEFTMQSSYSGAKSVQLNRE
jgi:hypothetical protein